MAVVPFSRQDEPASAPTIDPTYLYMAAANMHSMGRLFESEPDEPGASDMKKAIDRKVKDPGDPMDKPMPEAGTTKDEMTPEKLQRGMQKAPPETIYDDKGNIVDFDVKTHNKPLKRAK